MRYSIKGDTLPVVICELDEGEKIITEGGGIGIDVTKYENGNNWWWHWKNVWQSFIRRYNFSKYLYC